jgi:hypothetical protein
LRMTNSGRTYPEQDKDPPKTTDVRLDAARRPD